MVNNQNHFAIINYSPKIGKLNIDKGPWTIVRIFTSNCISRLFWFGTDGVGILSRNNRDKKEAKAAALQLRSPAGCGGEGCEFKRAGGVDN